MKYNGFNLSVRGYSHILKNTVCQDSSRCFFADEFAVAAVSDGHGSARHFRSDKGSEIAARTAVRTVCDFFERNKGLGEAVAFNPEKALRKIEANILLNWNEEVNAHCTVNPFSESERAVLEVERVAPETAYGATLLVGVVTKTHIFGIQIGDGGFLMALGDDMLFPMPDDLRLVANFTTSLCDADAISEFRHFCTPASDYCGVFLCTDGLMNSFASEDNYVAFAKRFFGAKTAVSRVADNLPRVADNLPRVADNLPRVADNLPRVADNLSALREHLSERSEKGSRDDISVACVGTVCSL